MKALLACLIATVLFVLGYTIGIRHAMEDSVVTLEDDMVIIEIDGELYVHLV